jgi:hypothetical protein
LNSWPSKEENISFGQDKKELEGSRMKFDQKRNKSLKIQNPFNQKRSFLDDIRETQGFKIQDQDSLKYY